MNGLSFICGSRFFDYFLHFEDFSLVGVDFGWDVEKGSDKEEVKSGTDDEFSSFEDGDEVFKIFFPIQNLYVRTPRRFDFTQTPFRRPLSVFAFVRPPPSPFSRGTNSRRTFDNLFF